MSALLRARPSSGAAALRAQADYDGSSLRSEQAVDADDAASTSVATTPQPALDSSEADDAVSGLLLQMSPPLAGRRSSGGRHRVQGSGLSSLVGLRTAGTPAQSRVAAVFARGDRPEHAALGAAALERESRQDRIVIPTPASTTTSSSSDEHPPQSPKSPPAITSSLAARTLGFVDEVSGGTVPLATAVNEVAIDSPSSPSSASTPAASNPSTTDAAAAAAAAAPATPVTRAPKIRRTDEPHVSPPAWYPTRASSRWAASHQHLLHNLTTLVSSLTTMNNIR